MGQYFGSRNEGVKMGLLYRLLNNPIHTHKEVMNEHSGFKQLINRKRTATTSPRVVNINRQPNIV